jgi:hypothetical protein
MKTKEITLENWQEYEYWFSSENGVTVCEPHGLLTEGVPVEEFIAKLLQLKDEAHKKELEIYKEKVWKYDQLYK